MEILKTLLIFLPLLIMTIYIIVRSIMDRKIEKAEEPFHDHFISLAEKMLLKENKHININDCEIIFTDIDIENRKNPSAPFIIQTEEEKIPFDIKNGKVIRHRIVKK